MEKKVHKRLLAYFGTAPSQSRLQEVMYFFLKNTWNFLKNASNILNTF